LTFAGSKLVTKCSAGPCVEYDVVVLLTKHGGPEMLRYGGEAPDPTAGPGEVVVEIYAASVNAADYKVRLCAENPQSRGLFLRPISPH